MAKAKAVETHFFEIGKAYMIRTVTHYYTGRVVAVGPLFVLLENAAWIADTGRWHQALKDGTLTEVEPYPAPVAVGLGAIVDFTEWLLELPGAQK